NDSANDWLRRKNTNAGQSCSLFQEKYPELPPISQATVSKIEKQFRKRGHKIHIHTSSLQTASELNINHSSIIRVLTEKQMHPYKLRCSKIMLNRRWQTCIQLKATHKFQVMQYGSSRMMYQHITKSMSGNISTQSFQIAG
ncbi:hypothetical protein NQ318_006190, partial [Aromia moschata]